MERTNAEREQVILDTFIDLADTLASDYDVGELLQFLVDRSADILGADTAGVLLESESGALTLAAAVTEEMKAIEDAEISTGQGPCIEAYQTRVPVTVQDLATMRDRWPDVVDLLLNIGMRSGHAFPLQLRGDCIGALNLYARGPITLDEDDVRLAQAFADSAAIGILQRRKVTAAEERSAQLQQALESRIVIEQAKGVLAQRHGVDPDEAFRALRKHARDRQQKLHDLCRRVVEGSEVDVRVEGG